MNIRETLLDAVYYKCTYCGYVLTDDQYKNAIFDRCPRCTRHLSMWKQTNDMAIIKRSVSNAVRGVLLPLPLLTSKTLLTLLISLVNNAPNNP